MPRTFRTNRSSLKLNLVKLESRDTPATFVVTSFNDSPLTGLDVTTGKLASGEITLRSAILAANDGANPGLDTIQLPTGGYSLSLTGQGEDLGRTGDLDILDDLILQSEPGVQIIGSNQDRLLDIPNSGVTVRIEGGIFRDGNLTETATDALGGGIRNFGNLTLNDVVIRENGVIADTVSGVISAFGGGLYSSIGTVTITNSFFINNIVAAKTTGLTGLAGSASGGGLYIANSAGQNVITNTRFNFNQVGAGSLTSAGSSGIGGTARGGAVSVNMSAATFDGVKIDENFAFGGDATNTNTARGGDARGGGLHASNSSITIVNSLIATNSAFAGKASAKITSAQGGDVVGGGISLETNNNVFTIQNSTVTGNFIKGSDATSPSVTLATSGRTVGAGIGIDNFTNLALIGNVTITNNSGSSGTVPVGGLQGAKIGGGLLVNDPNPNSKYNLRSALIAGNFIDGAADDVAIGNLTPNNSLISQGNNLIGANGPLTGLVNGVNNDQVGNASTPIDAKIAPLGFYGGQNELHALNIGSPARDKGSDGGLAADARGSAFLRVVNGQADVGAFEVQIPSTFTLNPVNAVVGKPTTFTAVITDPRLPPTGTVTFRVNGSAIGSAIVDNFSGTATFVLPAGLPTPGPATFDAVYSGDVAFLGGTTAPQSFTVQIGVTNEVTLIATELIEFQPLTFQSKITADDGSTPTGTVQFTLDGVSFGTPVLVDANGIATLSLSGGLPAGAYTLNGQFIGTGLYHSAFDPSPVEFSISAPTPTTTILVLAPTTTIVSNAVSLSASVSAGSLTPVGSVEFQRDGTTFAKVLLDASGTATTSATAASVGNFTFVANYIPSKAAFQSSSSAPQTLTVTRDSTATTLVVIPSATVAGIGVTLQATVSETNILAPGGSVEFFAGAQSLGTAPVDTNGVATFNSAPFSVGSVAITATYLGDANFNGSSSSPVLLEIDPVDTTTNLVVVPNPTLVGTSITFTATVNESNPLAPSGSVDFVIDGKLVGSTAVDAKGVATLSLPQLPVGSVSIAANYGGDANFFSSSSSPVSLTINRDTTTTALVVAPNPGIVGSGYSFTATVSETNSLAPTGAVQFFIDGTAVGTATVDAKGVATLAIAPIAASVVNVSAKYVGDANFIDSTSAPVSLTTNRAGTTTSLDVTPNPVALEQTVTLTATVSDTITLTPTGAVSFLVDGKLIGTASIDPSGLATLTVGGGIDVGARSVVAIYNGDANFTNSASPTVDLLVQQAPTTITISVSPNPTSATLPVTFTATVADLLPNRTPTGTVSIVAGGNLLATVPVDSKGLAVFTAPAGFAAGNILFSATYGGDTSFLASTSSTNTLTILPISTSVSIVASPNPTAGLQAVTLTAPVVPSIGNPGALPGVVTFFLNGTQVAQSSVGANGSAVASLAGQQPGLFTLTAEYSGGGNFTGSKAAPVSLTVSPFTTTTQLSLEPNPVFATDPITVDVVVTSAVTPTGTVNILRDGQPIGTVTLDSNGAGTFTISNGLDLGRGTATITANFPGDAKFVSSTASQDLQIVAVPTATTLTSSLNPAVLGKSLTLTATVAFGAGVLPNSPIAFQTIEGQASSRPARTAGLDPNLLNSGTVNFFNGTTQLGSVPVANGTASLTISSLPLGTNTLSAVFVPANPNLVTSTGRLTQTILAAVQNAPNSIFAVGLGFGVTSVVKVYDANANLLREIVPFGADFTCGCPVATADVNGDGAEDIIVTSTIGGGPHVKIYDGRTFNEIGDFFAYDPTTRNGVTLAAGDLDGDGVAEIVTGEGLGGSPEVRIFRFANGQVSKVGAFNAYESTFKGGVNVAVAQGRLVTGAGVGGGPLVKVFTNLGQTLASSFFAFDPASRAGVNVALQATSSDPVIIAGTSAGRLPEAATLTLSGQRLTDAIIYEPGFRGGVTVSDVEPVAGETLIVYGTGLGGGPRVRLANQSGTVVFDFFAFDPAFRGGVFVG